MSLLETYFFVWKNYMSLLQFLGDSRHGNAAPAFLEAGTWTYPLVRGRSPVLKTE